MKYSEGALIKAYLRPLEDKEEEKEKKKGQMKELPGVVEKKAFEKNDLKTITNAPIGSFEYASDSIVYKKDALKLLKAKNLKTLRAHKHNKKLSPLEHLLREIRDPQIAQNCTNVLEHFRKIASTPKKTVTILPPVKSISDIPTVKSKKKKKKKKRKKKKRTKSSLRNNTTISKPPTFTLIETRRRRLDSLGYPIIRSDPPYYYEY